MLLPSVINIVHSAEDHDHNTHCENKSDTHIHETELDCSLCDLMFLNDGVFSTPSEFVFTTYNEVFENATITQKVYISVYQTKDSRGPPNC